MKVSLEMGAHSQDARSNYILHPGVITVIQAEIHIHLVHAFIRDPVTLTVNLIFCYFVTPC